MSISTEITRLNTAKSDLKTSINAKLGSQTPIANELIDDYASFVDNISTGVPINNQNKSITANGSYTADAGYTGLGTVSVSVTPNTSDATATASDIASGTTAYVASGKVTGTGDMVGNYINLNPANNTRTTACITKFPLINTSGYTSMSEMFINCSSLTTIPLLNTSNVTNMNQMFYSCSALTTIPLLDTSNVTDMSNMFYSCSRLTTIPLLDTSNVTGIYNMFSICYALTTFGGLQNLGQAYLTTTAANYFYYKLGLSYSTQLTHDSLMNVINNLYDIATKGCNTQSLQIGSTNMAKLTAAEIAIATDKGWTVS